MPPVSQGGGDAAESQISPRREMGNSQIAHISSVPKGLMGVRVPRLGLVHFHAYACL